MNILALDALDKDMEFTSSKLTILNALFETNSYNIFKSIAESKDILITALKITRKQYYSSISLMMRAGLVKRGKGKYLLTILGKMVYSALTDLEAKIENAVQNYWKLRAIDLLQEPTTEERNKLVALLIESQQIRKILLDQEAIT